MFVVEVSYPQITGGSVKISPSPKPYCHACVILDSLPQKTTRMTLCKAHCLWLLALTALLFLANRPANGADPQLTGTIIGTSGSLNDAGNTREKAMDGDLDTFFEAPIADGAWVGLDLGPGPGALVTSVQFAPREEWASAMIGGVFQGANNSNFTDAVTLYTVTTQPNEGGLTTVTVSNPTRFRYLRYLGPDGSYGNIAEVLFFGQMPPPPPTGLKALPSNGQISLSWNASPNATSYYLKRATVRGGPYTTIRTNTTTSYVNTGLINGTNYYYVVSALNAYGQGANSDELSATPRATLFAINAGGAASSPFTADAYYSGGATSSTTSAMDLSAAPGPAPSAVYQSDRLGNFSYTFTNLLTNANYKVRLHFAEFYFDRIGQRKFNVSINSTLMLSNFDIFASIGVKNKAIVREFASNADTNGQLLLQFTSLVNSAKVSGIEILQGGISNAPPAPAWLTATGGNAVVSLAWAPSTNAVCYNLKRAVTGGGAYTNIATLTTNLYFDTAVTNGLTYSYLVAAVNAAGESPDSPSAVARPRQSLSFGVYRELWTGLPSSPNNLAALTNTTYNPNWPDNPNDTYTKTFATFETETNTGITYYGQRLRTFVVPPTNGLYRFWIASDDTSRLFLSSNENPSNTTAIAWVNGWTSSRQWTVESNQQSAAIYLEAGRRYYLEALMQQGGGGDNLAVRWQLPNGAYEEPLTSTGSYGTVLIPCNGLDTIPSIYRQSTNTTVFEGRPIVLSVLATNQAPLAYQWIANGVALLDTNASKSVYTIPRASLTLSGQVFCCILSNASGVVTSTPVTVSVLMDDIPPTVIRAFNAGTTNIQIVFSEPVETASATNIANYACTNGIAITSAQISSDNTTVTLTLASPMVNGTTYGILLNGLRDTATTPNFISPNTLVSFVALPYLLNDIGVPAIPSRMAWNDGGMDVTAAGQAIGGNNDQCGFAYQTRTGDFDISVRLAGLDISDVWAKAGLMARDTFDSAGRFAAVFATPSMNGSFFEYRSSVSAASQTSGSFPANFPNTWLRLTRVGNTFSGYASYDGETWTRLGTITIAMPNEIYVGLTVTSANLTQTTTAQFRDITNNTGAVTLGTILDPHEPLGVSSRSTPLVISEIMYKPAPRDDGRNLEFIEIYNTNPWFHDLSGYRLTANNLSYTFPAGTRLAGGAFLVIAAVPSDIQAVYGIRNVVGPYTGSLKKSDTIELRDEQNSILLSVPYKNRRPWPAAADGTGHSLVLAYPTYGEADPRAWDISDIIGGSPGQREAYRPSPLRNVLINEFLAHTDDPQEDFIELYNHSTQSVNIAGCILTDDPTTNRFVIPNGTVIPPTGFVVFTQSTLGFSLDSTGEIIYFKNPSQTRILDCVDFGGQENGVAMGRWPNGAKPFYRLATPTPGASNADIRLPDIVINELMYQPISGDDDDQFIELYNRTSKTINLGGWRLSDGISFTFPTGTVLAANSYLVVARNAAHLRQRYPHLTTANCLGDFSGRLAHSGERVALDMPHYDIIGGVTNLSMYVTINEVTYGTGGRWPQWANGGGSSMELIDPNSDNRLAANWADSDETSKSVWTNIEYTGTLDLGSNYDPSILYAQIGLLNPGECLVDDIEIIGSAGTNLVLNPGFESGTNNWYFQGCMSRSSLTNAGYSGSQSLLIRCSDQLWTGANSCEMALATNTLASGQTATLRFKARWLRGWPEVLLRLNGNWLEATGRLPVPTNLGTPAQPNSRRVANAGPAIFDVSHWPTVPGTNEPVVVTARVHDPQGIASFTLFYRVDPDTNTTAVAMLDNGTGGDAVAGDGLYSATIPGQSLRKIVAFYLTATDGLGATSRFPALRDDNAPVRECVVLFGDENPSGSFGVYHHWVTTNNITRWINLSNLSNESHDGTLVHGKRIIYNMQARYAGSPYHQNFNTPTGNLCHYVWEFPNDDKLFGATSFNKVHQPGNSAGSDTTLQREQTAYTFMRALGVPWLNRRYIAVYVNGVRRGTFMEDTQRPSKDFIEQYWPDDSDGWLYKMQPWFEFGPAPSGTSISFANKGWCTLQRFLSGGQHKTARYRYNYLVRRTPDNSMNSFAPVFALVDAASTTGSVNYAANMQHLADMENWMRVLAANHAAGNWDCFAVQNGQNLYGYMGTKGTRYSLLMWDFNIVLGGAGSWGPGSNLFSTSSLDGVTAYLYKEPEFRRMYVRALQELVNGPLDASQYTPLLDAKYRAFLANGQSSVVSPDAIKTWMAQARDSIAAQLIASNANASFTVNPGVTVTNNIAILSGTAPVAVKNILINGTTWPVTWTSLTGWTARIAINPGTNFLNILGVNMQGQALPGASNTVTAVGTGAIPSAVGQIVINEIMYGPVIPGAEYVELYNTSTNITFDLSGWQFNGLAYTFPPGTLLGPTNFLVLAANAFAFAQAYGATNAIFDTFSGSLQTNGETLTLIQPGPTNTTIAKVRYDATLPWPTNALGTGLSLQLRDPRQDNWRAGNWTAAAPTPGAPNSVLTNLPPFQPLWLNELQPDNLTGITNSEGKRTSWIELYNPTTNTVSLAGLYLSTAYTNLSLWAFPTNAVIGPGEFKVIFADGDTDDSTPEELHTSFTLSSMSGALALSRFTNNQWQVLDYINYNNVATNRSYGSLPDAQSFTRQEFHYVTPGTNNNGASLPITVVINEWMADNTRTLVNPINGKYDDWFELYNYGTDTVNLAGYYLTDTANNPTKSVIPNGYTIPPGGFLLVWADNKTTNNTPDLHANFALAKDGESIGLFAPDGTAIDFINFAAQSADVSQGRYPDAGSNICFMYTPTPRTNNIIPIITLTTPVSTAYEHGPINALLQLVRTGDTNATVTVTLQLDGTASNGVDCATIPTTILLPSTCTSTNITIAPVADNLAEGDEYLAVTIQTNPTRYAITPPGFAIVTIKDAPLDAWQFQQFGTNANNPLISGPTCDPDGDGIPNLTEYALNLNPLLPSVTGLPTVTITNGHLTLTYTRPKSATDVTYAVEVSGSVVNGWSSASTEVDQFWQVTDNGDTQTIIARDKMPLTNAPCRFIRLRISRP